MILSLLIYLTFMIDTNRYILYQNFARRATATLAVFAPYMDLLLTSNILSLLRHFLTFLDKTKSSDLLMHVIPHSLRKV